MSRLAIATPHRLASEAGAAAFRAGGTAVDAALAAAAVLAVVAPQDCALGGDAFALVALPGGEVHAVNGSGAAAAAVDPAAVRARHDGTMPIRGPDTITVPGAVAAWEAVGRLGARLPWAERLAPAAAYAREDGGDGRALARALAAEAPLIRADPGLREVLGDGTLRQPALADTLEALRDGGADALYRGEIGVRLVAGLRALGSPLAEADLAAHATELTAPLHTRFAGRDVLTAPPNSQGYVLLELLRPLEQVGGVPDPAGRELEALGALCRHAAAERDRTLADPRVHRAGGDTVAIAALDDEGHAVSLIQSLYWAFGAGVLEPATGILCHNRGAAFSLDPGAPNALRGGARPPHTLMPVLVRRDGQIEGAHGTMGGRAQPCIHLQVLLRLLRGASASEAVAAPRWIVDPGGRLLIEEGAGAPPPDAIVLEPHRDEAGHAQVARWGEGGLEAGADPRADAGAALVVTR